MDDIIAEHLPYEIDMLVQTFDKLNRPPKEYDRVEVNALIESFCVHARNLFEFFDKGPRNRKELPATYCRPGYARIHDATDLRQQINQQISHLIYGGRSRVDADKIQGAERLAMIRLLRDEVEHFKANMLDPAWANPLWDIPLYVTVSCDKPDASSAAPQSV